MSTEKSELEKVIITDNIVVKDVPNKEEQEVYDKEDDEDNNNNNEGDDYELKSPFINGEDKTDNLKVSEDPISMEHVTSSNLSRKRVKRQEFKFLRRKDHNFKKKKIQENTTFGIINVLELKETKGFKNLHRQRLVVTLLETLVGLLDAHRKTPFSVFILHVVVVR